MSQLMNQGTSAASLAEAPTKRRRGRPRKDENQAPPRPPVPSIQREGSGVHKPTSNTPSKGKESIEDVDDDDYNNDEMVGQVVTGILEYAFDAGYFLSVKVGDSNVCMRGVVFKEECVVPITHENDIAPNAKMYKRKEFPDPPMNISPQVPAQTARISSLNPTENIKAPQQKLPSPSFSLKEDHNLLQKGQTDDKEQQEKASDDMEHQKLSDDKGQQEKLTDDKEQQEKLTDDKEQQEKLTDDKEQQEKLTDDKEQQEKLSDDEEQHEKLSNDKDQLEKVSVGDDIKEEGSAKMEALKDLSESPLKRQKTDTMIVSHSNGVEIEQHNTLTFENSEDSVKSVEEFVNIVLPEEAMISLPEIAPSVKDLSVDVPTVMEQVISRTSGFQISMENADDEDELSEPPSEASPMATD